MRLRDVTNRPAVLLAACLTGATLGTAQQPDRPVAPPPPRGSLFFHPERVALPDGRLVDAERGLLFVPVNRAAPDHGVIGLEIWRFRAAAPNDVPPIFVLHGGPGFPGLDPALERPDYYARRLEPFTRVADLIVVGQRGIGGSRPDTKCDRGPAYQASVRCRKYWTDVGLDLAGFTAVEAASDVVDVAAALGYQKIIVWGGSFGSHWGMALMRSHPELVARAVLTGMEGPNHTYDSSSWVLNSLRRLAAAAERDPRVQAIVPPEGLIGALAVVRQRLAEEPVSVEAKDPETGKPRSLRFTAASVPGFSNGYTASVGSRSGAATWPADVLRLYYGDFETVARRRLTPADGGSRPYRTASYFMLDCGSGITAERLDALRADSARFLVGDRTAFYQASCQAWDADLGDDFRRNFDTEIPTAIVHGNWDISTPYENALELAPHFKRGRLVTVAGGTHGAIFEALQADTTFAEQLWHFVRTGDLSRLPDTLRLPPIEWSVPDDLVELAKRGPSTGGSASR